MAGVQSGEAVSAAAAAQFAAGAGAFGWAGYARAWMDLKQTVHEKASAAAQRVWLSANQAAFRAYDLALGSRPETGSAGETPGEADRAIAEQAGERAWVQYVKDAANALPGFGSVGEVVGAAVLAERIWDAVAATQTPDPAGVLSRAAAVSGTAETVSGTAETVSGTAETVSGTAETVSDTAESRSDLSDAWENVSDTSDTSWENVPEPAENGDTAEGWTGSEVTWLRAPGDMIPHLLARNAAPRGRGVRTLVAHSDGSALVDGDSRLTAEQVAGRLGLPVVSAGPDGPSVPPLEPVTVVMLVCDAARGFVPSDLAAPRSVSSLAGELHKVTGQRVVAPVRRAIMMPGG
jgi:hypothetical protein